ncbi:MAG: DUF1839 family protein [Hyphomicrobiales bacterium]|nr:DUF1839 family protein [Hyphomicrobiales bacterium]
MRSRSEGAFAPNADAARWRADALHDPSRDWPQTNCYVDLWIEAIHARGLPAQAMLGFTARLDFEGDQFTFFKPPLEDIEALYGFVTRELSLYDDVEGHIVEQCAQGRLVMIETDAFFLPDTRGVSYRTEQSKTTVGVNRIDPVAKTIDYFHNDGFFRLSGEDYDGAVAFGADLGRQKLPPYAEIVKPDFAPPGECETRGLARALLHAHIERRPTRNPVSIFAERLPSLVARAAAREPAFFHKFAFNTMRQLGANFELMASHLDWLGEAQEFTQASEHCRAISAGAKAFQFLLARAIMRGKSAGLDAPLAALADRYEALFTLLARNGGALRRAG